MLILLSLALSRSWDGTYDTLLHGKALLVITAGDAEDLWHQSRQYVLAVSLG